MKQDKPLAKPPSGAAASKVASSQAASSAPDGANDGRVPTRQSAALADGMVRSAVDAVITIDETGIICAANPAVATQFGYVQNELIGKNVSILLPVPERAMHDDYLRRYLQTGQKNIVGIGRDVVGERKDGSQFPMHLSVSEFYADGRRLFTGIIHDLTMRKAMENELRQQRALFRSIFNHVPDAMAITDEECKVSLCNPALIRIFGYDSPEIVGHTLKKCFADDKDYDRGRTIGELADETEADPLNVKLRRRSGEIFPAQLVRSRIQDEDGSEVGILVLIRDMSAEHEREEALRHTQRMEAIGQLTGGIAHDFNNLLTVITGNHELLEMRLEREKNRDLLHRAEEAAQMGARLTNRLLAFARRSRLDPAVVNLNDLVLATMEILPRALGSSIDVRSHLAADLWQTKADVSEVENAILNLAINARDAMGMNGILNIETANSSAAAGNRGGRAAHEGHDFVRLSVSDDGHGMEPEVLSHVFEPFFTTKETGRGTGLGLSTLYGFAKQSGGYVTIQSAPGNGTTVNLYLPRYLGDPALAREKKMLAAGGEINEATILVVEDNSQVRALVGERLQGLGYLVVPASTGLEAIKLLETERVIDLVFSDIVMPGGVSGFELAAWVRQNRPALPVLLTTGYTDQAQKEIGAKSDLSRVAILRKPYSQNDLAQAIRKTLQETS